MKRVLRASVCLAEIWTEKSNPRCLGQVNSARSPAPRGGAVALIAMIGVLVAGMITGTLVRLAITRYRQVERESHRLQADWLAEAGLERAAARLAADPEYRGDTWSISSEHFGRNRAGRVTITITTRDAGDASTSALEVKAVADYPVDGVSAARARKSVLLR